MGRSKVSRCGIPRALLRKQELARIAFKPEEGATGTRIALGPKAQMNDIVPRLLLLFVSCMSDAVITLGKYVGKSARWPRGVANRGNGVLFRLSPREPNERRDICRTGG